MGERFVGCCLFTSLLSYPCFSQTTPHQKGEELKQQKEEREEIQQVKAIITAQCGFNQQEGHVIPSSQGQCLNGLSHEWTMIQDPQVLVFISCSVPNSAWVSLSRELEKVGGMFVLRGLPNQSFQLLASRILQLKEQGVNAPIQLDPKRFITYEIHQVPAIVVVEEQAFDKVSGHVSLKFALEKMAERGETKAAKTLYHSFKDRL